MAVSWSPFSNSNYLAALAQDSPEHQIDSLIDYTMEGNPGFLLGQATILARTLPSEA